jgi:hypothetical protein
MQQQVSRKVPKILVSPLHGIDLITTHTAAKILFPNESPSKKRLRLVQRLCETDQLESYKIGGKYQIVRQSVYDYIEENHGRNAKSAASDRAASAYQIRR